MEYKKKFLKKWIEIQRKAIKDCIKNSDLKKHDDWVIGYSECLDDLEEFMIFEE